MAFVAKHNSSNSFKKASFSKFQLAIFVLVFGLLGGFVIWRSFAAGTVAPNVAFGDLNNDGFVNVTDLSILISNYNTANTSADMNGDGLVSIFDLSMLLSHYNQTYSATAIWTGDMEEGTLADFYNPATCECTSGNHGGGEFNSGGGDSMASQTFAHNGSWSAKQTINTSGGSSGTRLFRWQEFRDINPGQGLYESAWIYIPQTVSVGNSFNIDQFKSKTQDGAYVDVFFQLNLRNKQGGGLYLAAAWGCGAENPSFPLGPYSNSTSADNCNYFTPLANLSVPIGQWFQIKTYTVPSSGYTGVFKAWQDNTLIYDFQNVKTGYANTNSVNGVDTQWAINAYANGLNPSAYIHYVDDANISTSF